MRTDGTMKAETELLKYFLRNGYFRLPDKERRKKLRQKYKKGYEVRLVAANRRELMEIRSLLKIAGFRSAKAFPKHSQYVQPVYGEAAVREFSELVTKHRVTRGKNKNAQLRRSKSI